MSLSPEQCERIRLDQERINDEQARKSGEEHRNWSTAAQPTPSGGQGASRGNADWLGLLRRRGDQIIGDEANVLQALRAAPELVGLIRFNEFAARTELTASPPWRKASPGAEWTDADDVDLQAWLQMRSIAVKARGCVADCVSRVARDHLYHPVRDYLTGLTWDQRARLTHWLIDYAGAEGPAPYLEAIGPAFLISAVARVMQPGCQADHVLVLEGTQGTGKTSAVRILGRPWLAEGLPDLANKDAALHLAGAWIVELSELAGMRRSEIEHVKAFLSRSVDRFRPPYGRRTLDQPRQCVFIATTNEQTYLRDPSGNRRFWPVRCGAIDLTALERDRDQLWAEAMLRYRLDEAWHLTGTPAQLAAGEQDARHYVTELEQDVADYLARMEPQGCEEVSVRDVLLHALRIDSATDPRGAAAVGDRVAAALNRAGWERVARTGHGEHRRTVYRRRKADP